MCHNRQKLECLKLGNLRCVCVAAESAIDVPQLDPFEEEEERQFSLRLHRGASFTSMASSAAGEPPVSKGLNSALVVLMMCAVGSGEESA